jgi:diguanylate cyclase (GGDEF)-like protein
MPRRPTPWPGFWPPRRLSTRLVLLFLGVLLLVQLAAFGVVRSSIDTNARALLSQELEVGERVWARLLDQRAQKLLLGASVLAADYGFRSAAASGDRDTLASALDNHGSRIGATVTAMLDTRFQPVALSEGTDPALMPRLQALSEPLARQGSGLALMGERPYQFVMVPMKAPQTIGWVLMGFALDDAVVQDMRAVSSLHVAILVQPARGVERVALSTLPPAQAAELLQQPVDGELVALGDDPHVCRAIEAAGGFQAAIGASAMAGGRMRTLLLRSVAEAVAPYRQLQALLAAITAAGIVLGGLGSLVTARRVTTPLGALVRAAGRLGAGDYSQPVGDRERRDEVGQLAEAFDHMRVSIAAHQAEIRDLAFRDRLTGLPNRLRLRDALQACIGAADGPGSVAVLMFGLDRFKHVNDVLGYAFGDRLLQAVAGRVAGQALDNRDLFARLGGDEFAVLLPDHDATRAEALARRIAAALEAPLVLDDQTVDISAAFGIACWPQHAADADMLLGRAEVAMYVAKRKTLPCVVYDAAIDSASAQTLSLLSELRRALERDELRLFLQPKIALKTGAFVGAEALVRWQHPVRGMVPPLHFIPFAEQTGFVRQLTLWMFGACAREWPALRTLGVQRVSVNLSTRDLLDLELPQRLLAILGRLGVPPQAFCLEITESAIMDEPQRALGVLQALSDAGFKLSIDDFGTGYSSLAYLKRLPVDELKIDKSFVMAMEHDADDAKIVRSTIDLAHNLGLSVVAEGIENATIYELLRGLGCDEGQGYHMGRPLPAQEMAAFAARWREREGVAVA